MRLFPDPDETILGMAKAIREGRRSCLAALENCLARIEAHEPQVHAWVLVDREAALARARLLDEELAEGKDRGPLHGIPLGIKDIIDVRGLPTGCGSPRPTGLEVQADARLVSRLREAGAVILGKTVTTAYAWIDPPVTRNPWNPFRTPGGSSSGSAAAVASGMCLGAIGTQTGGSIIRPASFCGVCGFKPTFGKVPTAGILPFAASLDHPGPIARSVADLEVIYRAIRDPDGRGLSSEPQDAPPTCPALRLGRLDGFFARRAEPEMFQAVRAFSNWLKSSGAALGTPEDPVDFNDLLHCHRRIMAFEAAALHKNRLALDPEAYPPRITELIREGAAIVASDYLIDLERRKAFAQAFGVLFEKVDALITPATVGPAPDPSTTGDPAFNSPWSYLGFPTVTFPMGFSAEGLPLGLQLIGRHGSDLDLLRTAARCEKVVRSAH